MSIANLCTYLLFSSTKSIELHYVMIVLCYYDIIPDIVMNLIL